MKIAIYGTSCTGKTTIAKLLAKALGLKLRSCGEEIKIKANELNASLGDLSAEDHQEIDNDTLSWAKENSNCIVEGRFLDFVLSTMELDVLFIKLVASESERFTRLLKRGKPNSIEDLRHIDCLDKAFCELHYKNQVKPNLIFDTSGLTIEECLEQIKRKL